LYQLVADTVLDILLLLYQAAQAAQAVAAVTLVMVAIVLEELVIYTQVQHNKVTQVDILAVYKQPVAAVEPALLAVAVLITIKQALEALEKFGHILDHQHIMRAVAQAADGIIPILLVVAKAAVDQVDFNQV
jgi:hypothetical protein